MKNSFILFTFLCLAVNTECYGGLRHDPLRLLLKKKESAKHYNLRSESLVSKEDSPVLVGPHAGRREDDKIRKLPGQPSVKFSQFSGYVTVDPKAGRALFYYFVEVENPLDKPLVLWLNGGLGCSSFGFGAMMELGPFRVNPDGKTLWYNQYAWNKVANVLFLESPAGVGFSHSKNLTDYLTGDDKTTADSYTFLLNWFERFPVYKTQDFFLAGESYADYYILQLADLILHNNKNTKHTIIKLKGIVLGNSLIDYQDSFEGRYNYWWTHALVSDESYSKIVRNCNFSPNANVTQLCIDSIRTTKNMIGNVNRYNIYAPLCLNGSSTATPYVVVDATVVE